MVFEHIEKLKHEYTDKWVQVDAKRPELARFEGIVGQVKTVNMSGRALVEFDQYHLNIGWYDIEVDFLKVVDAPAAKEEKKKAKPAARKAPAAKPAAGGLSPLELARQQGAAKPAGDKPSTADILAAARQNKGGAPSGPAAPSAPAAGGKPSTADILAAARGNKPAADTTSTGDATSTAGILAAARRPKGGGAATGAPSKPAAAPAAKGVTKLDRSQMSVADILASARANQSAGDAPAVADAPEAEAPAEAPPAATEPPAAEAPAASPSPSAGETVDRNSMSVDDMIAWCRAHDGGG